MNGLIERLRLLGLPRVLMLGGLTLGLIVFLTFIVNRIMQPPMALLYGDLDVSDASQITQKLDAQHIPYQLSSDGTRVMVPEDQVTHLRMSMAEAGLPSGGSVGYELFDHSDAIGTTSFVQRINRLRALEGEIARTISSINRVVSARVHLVLRERKLFARQEQEPSASIMLKLRGSLDQTQIRAIQQLTAAAVAGLAPDRVSIVDSRGDLLASGIKTNGDSTDLAAETAAKTRDYQNKLRRQLEQLVGASVGPDHVRAEVAAEINFNRVTTQTDSYDPDSQVARSTQTVNDTTRNTDSNGKQPVSVQTNVPGAQQNQGGNNKTSTSQTARNEETTNYEISRTQKTIVREGGDVQRLSVAILVDGTYKTKPDGTRVYTPRSKAELDKIAALVKSAIGFDESRGDQVHVETLPFLQSSEPQGSAVDAATAMFFGLSKADMFRIGEIAVLALITLLVVIFVVRPMMNRLIMPAMAVAGGGMPMGSAEAVEDGQLRLAAPEGGAGTTQITGPQSTLPNELEQMVDLAHIEGKVRASSLNRVGDIIDNHPEEAIAIMRTWLYRES